MRSFIETRRLFLRPFEPHDAEAAFRWFGDPIVMRYMAHGPDRSIAETQARIERYVAHQLANGFSKWLVLDRQSGQPIGDAGLLDLRDQGWIDLGFRLAHERWGKGLATEIAAAWVDVAFGELALAALGAFAHVDNAASIRVLEKVGFQKIGHRTIDEIPSLLFTLSAQSRTQPRPLA